MKEIEENKAAWGSLSKAHYKKKKKALQENRFGLAKLLKKN
jgi:hypothetical protein